ncbi:hypothetical protein BD626DRAFT_582591 [Schizophyllum amplum]|uniref:F-box domain-containing protein n=1 Tax=Schizophyllum amplum TaxID=97359 RepID=A0A550CIU2_9AGAR|nr:hypothetical protein BD626DRAFT_582591 [Auriculariopsis ampla]
MAGRIGSLHTLKLHFYYSQDLHIFLAPGAQCLRSLDLAITVLADPVDAYALEGLRYLRIRKQSMAFAGALVGSPHIEEIDVLEATIADSDALAQLMNKIHGNCQPDVLRRVRIHERLEKDVQTWHVTRRHLAALMSFHGLVEVDICTTGELSMTDVDWAAVVPQWCSLRVFKVKQAFSRRGDIGPTPATVKAPPPDATLGALITFATHCPELEELALQLHATTIPTLVGPQLTLSQNRLYELDIGRDCGIHGMSTLVFDFLHSLFPSLRTIKVDPKPDDYSNWGLVQWQARMA